MKRILQILALGQFLLVIALGVRLVGVWSTPLPEFVEIPQLPALTPLPPPRPPVKLSATVTEDIVDHDLFDDERGQRQDDVMDGVVVDEAPIAPPSTVKLMGVMMIGAEPVGILLDTNVKPEQESVRKGEMFGEYQVGDISESGLMLLGGSGQQFRIPLQIVAGSAPPMPMPGTVPPPGRATPPPRGATARPANPRNDSAAQKAQSARERAAAIAQRNAEMRKTGERNDAGGESPDGQNEETAPDPVQARLEALRALREAAKSR